MRTLPVRRTYRAAAVVAALAVTATTISTAATPAQAQPAGDRAVGAGTAWLKAQLTDGIVIGEFEGSTYDDFGLTADTVFALDAVGGQGATIGAIADAVAPKVDQWYDSFGTLYAGSAAKAIAMAQVAGRDATSFGGNDLQTVVEGTVGTQAPIVGRVQNVGETDYEPPYGPVDSLNVISQSWAARGLTGQGSALADEVTSFLLQQQCSAGFFREKLTVDKSAPQQGCVAGTDSGSVDTTALTVINILDTPEASAPAKGAAYLAASWLRKQQAADGSFAAGALGPNANSTGLAAWALAATGYDGAARRAASWLRGLQVADLAPCATTLAPENGAIAYKPADLAAARTAGGIAVAARDGFRRASVQSVPALAYVPAGAAVSLSAPATAVEKSRVTVTVTGLGAGEPGCVSFGSQVRAVTGNGDPVTATFDLPAGAAAHTFRVTTLGGASSATTAATAVPPVPVVQAQVGELRVKRVVTVKRNRFTVALTCAAGAACRGRLEVRTSKKVQLRSGKHVVTVAKRRYTQAAGSRQELVLKLTRAGRALIARDRGSIKVRAVQTAPGADRAVTTFRLKSARG